ncbi:hypothetical protein FHG87_014662 [Trinorchestia longiramus]|nr:hypothetical protein FHG87_014662 [Trinorchestia longiramus]
MKDFQLRSSYCLSTPCRRASIQGACQCICELLLNQHTAAAGGALRWRWTEEGLAVFAVANGSRAKVYRQVNNFVTERD